MYELSPEERRRVVCGADTLRVTVQRDAFERLLSSFKSKFTCDGEAYGTDVSNREFMVPNLLKRARMDSRKTCLSLDEFAEALERIRVQAAERGKSVLRAIDVHVRPAKHHFGDIDWDIVMDLRDLNDKTLLTAIVKRMKYAHLIEDGPGRQHISGKKELILGEKTAKLLHRFAMESEVGDRRIIDSIDKDHA